LRVSSSLDSENSFFFANDRFSIKQIQEKKALKSKGKASEEDSTGCNHRT